MPPWAQHLMNSIVGKLGSLESKVGSLESKVGSLESKVGSLESKFDSLESKFDSLESKFDSLESKVSNLDLSLNSRIDDVRDELISKITSTEEKLDNSINILKTKIDVIGGELAEKTLRPLISEHYGNAFSRPFVAKGLSGLARLIQPSKKESVKFSPRKFAPELMSKPDSQSDTQSHEKIQSKLRDYIYSKNGFFSLYDSVMGLNSSEPTSVMGQPKPVDSEEFKSMILARKSDANEKDRKEKFEEFISKCIDSVRTSADRFVEWKVKVLEALLQFGKQDRDAQLYSLLDDSGIGMLLFTSLLRDTNLHPTHEIDLDCRGEVRYHGETANVTVGEIKSACSTDSTKDAVQQLRSATSIISLAVRALKGRDDFPVEKIGLLIFPLREEKYHINPPKVSDLDLRILFY